MKVKLEEVERYERHVKMRLAFRFGVITVTDATQAVFKVRVSLADGQTSHGVAAEALAVRHGGVLSERAMSRDSLETSMPTKSLALASGEELFVTAWTLSCGCERSRASVGGSTGCSGEWTRRRLEPCFVTGAHGLDTIGCGPAAASA